MVSSEERAGDIWEFGGPYSLEVHKGVSLDRADNHPQLRKDGAFLLINQGTIVFLSDHVNCTVGIDDERAVFVFEKHELVSITGGCGSILWPHSPVSAVPALVV